MKKTTPPEELLRYLRPFWFLVPKPLHNLVLRLQEPIGYLIFGGLTALANIAVSYLAMGLLHWDYFAANTLGWIVALIVSFLTNKFFVFEDRDWSWRAVIVQLVSLALVRLLGYGAEQGFMYITVSCLKGNRYWMKIPAQILVAVVNYTCSKFFVFAKKKG